MTIKDIIGFYCTHTPLFHYLSNCTWQKAIGSRYSNNESSHAINGSIISWHQCIFIIRIQRNYQLKVQCNVDNIPNNSFLSMHVAWIVHDFATVHRHTYVYISKEHQRIIASSSHINNKHILTPIVSIVNTLISCRPT